jgi:hypothetical protein
MGPLLAVAAFLVLMGVFLAERKIAKRGRRETNTAARREQERHASAGRTALGLTSVEDIVRDAHHEEADHQMLRAGLCDVHDVFPKEED